MRSRLAAMAMATAMLTLCLMVGTRSNLVVKYKNNTYTICCYSPRSLQRRGTASSGNWAWWWTMYQRFSNIKLVEVSVESYYNEVNTHLLEPDKKKNLLSCTLFEAMGCVPAPVVAWECCISTIIAGKKGGVTRRAESCRGA